MSSKKPSNSRTDTSRGLVLGGRGGPEDELLEAGQEEVFSRTEVERGRIEHHSEAGSASSPAAPDGGKVSGGRQ